MNFLVDTHVLIWSLFEKHKLSDRVVEILSEPSHSWYVSPLSLIEISLKFSKGKIQLGQIRPDDLTAVATQAGFSMSDFTSQDVAGFWKLPFHHSDPFDRLLVWQSIQRGWTLLSKDSRLEIYKDHGLKVVW